MNVFGWVYSVQYNQSLQNFTYRKDLKTLHMWYSLSGAPQVAKLVHDSTEHTPCSQTLKCICQVLMTSQLQELGHLFFALFC